MPAGKAPAPKHRFQHPQGIRSYPNLQVCSQGSLKAHFFLLTNVGIDFDDLLNAAGFHQRGGDPLLHGQADALRGLDPDGCGAELETTTQSPPPSGGNVVNSRKGEAECSSAPRQAFMGTTGTSRFVSFDVGVRIIACVWLGGQLVGRRHGGGKQWSFGPSQHVKGQSCRGAATNQR